MDWIKTPHMVQLGAHFALSVAELKTCCTVLQTDERMGLALVGDLRIKNPRGLPQKPEQLFLNRLGGTQRIASVLGVFHEMAAAQAAVVDELKTESREHTFQLAVSGFGVDRKAVKLLLEGVKKGSRLTIKRANGDGGSITTGRLFRDKILKKGADFMLWKLGGEVLVARTKAIQNIRNYTLRDRQKPFRDAHMGMLPPKLAQILINLSKPKSDDAIIDPFCGSGTISIEAAIMGYRTHGSDIAPERVTGAQANNTFLSEKFRYDHGAVKFITADATQLKYQKMAGVIATEGWLGHNFAAAPTDRQSEKTLLDVIAMWHKALPEMAKGQIHTIALCLPVHQIRGRNRSISEKIFALADRLGYAPVALFGSRKSYVYARDGAYTSREIIVLKKGHSPG